MKAEIIKKWPVYGRNNRLIDYGICKLGEMAYLILDTAKGEDYQPIVYSVPAAEGPAVIDYFNQETNLNDRFRAKILPKLKSCGPLDSLKGELGEALRTAWTPKNPEEPE
jgi:hypothetical protein